MCVLSCSAAAAAKSLQLCPTLSDPMDCSLPGSSIHGIFQARVLEWGAITFSNDLSYPQTNVVLTSLVAQMVKNLPAIWKTQVRSLGQEDPLKEEMASHSSSLAWKIPWTEEPGRLESMGSQKVRHNLATKTT